MRLALCLLSGSFLLITACASADGEDAASEGDEALSVQKVSRISTISYAPNSFVIGNAYPSWTDDVQGPGQFSKGPGNPNGVTYRWGYIFGESFDHCAWLGDEVVHAVGSKQGNKCGKPQEIDTPYFLETYTNGTHNELAGDGSDTHMHYAGSGCTDKNAYGNVAPWRVPATPANRVGQVPDGKLLKWRYVTKDGQWVLVRDPAPPPNQPNWYFVHRGCVSVANTH